jgi:hypothetical protein
LPFERFLNSVLEVKNISHYPCDAVSAGVSNLVGRWLLERLDILLRSNHDWIVSDVLVLPGTLGCIGRVLLYVLVLAVSAAASALLVRWVINPPPKVPLDRTSNPWPWRPFDIAEHVNYDSTSALAPKVLVIRGVDDEAALALAFGAIATALNRFILTVTWKWLYPVVGVRCEIATDSVPDSRQVHIVTLKPSYRELVPQGGVSDEPSSKRHTIYDHPDCRREVVKWIAEHWNPDN